ncbi:MAG TPA: phage major capsid protein [Patescibacteria group bacterium]
MIATTLSTYGKQLADNVHKAIPLLAWLTIKKRVTEEGGASIIRPVVFASNSTAAFYSSDDVLDTTIQDNFTAAQWQWRQAAASIVVTGRIELQNAGRAQVIDYAKAQIDNALASLKETIDIKLFATAQAGSNITPLNAIISNTGTIGDINGGTNAFWQSTQTASGSFAQRGMSDLRTAWDNVAVRMPAGGPDLILSDQTGYEAYEATLTPTVRYTDVSMGDLGFVNLKYKEAVWTWDPNATAGYVYGLNSKALELVQHTNRLFTISEWVKPANQDLKVAQVFWAGECTTNNRRKLFLLTGVTA